MEVSDRIGKAIQSLNNARTELNVQSPCQLAPPFWEERASWETKKDYGYRVQAASLWCVRCPVLRACRNLAHEINPTNPEIRGIVAGELFDPTPEGEWVRNQREEVA